MKVLAIASWGGHWVQLKRLLPALDGHDVVFACSGPVAAEDVGDRRFYEVSDASRWSKLGLARVTVQLVGILWRERPRCIITTGAAPGLIALALGRRLFGARTIWVDSVANVAEVSLSGRLAGRFSDLWLTQWPHLAKGEGPRFAGSVL